MRKNPAVTSIDSTPRPGLRARFTRFRRTRPFWGSLVLLLGAYLVGNPIIGGGFSFIVDMGQNAAIALVIALGMALAALVALFAPAQRIFPGLIAMVLSVASLPLANLGGWIVGMLFGIIGSGMVFAWAPYTEKQIARINAKRAAKLERKAARGTRGATA